MSDNKYTRVPEDSPDRCQAVVKTGQCPFKRVEGAKNCPMHAGAASSYGDRDPKLMAGYLLTKWHARVSEMENASGVKSLRSEIGITRMLLEQVLERCPDEDHLIMYAPRISQLVTNIKELVMACDKLEKSTGMLLDKSAALQMAGKVVEIVASQIPDPVLLESIADDIAKAFIIVEE